MWNNNWFLDSVFGVNLFVFVVVPFSPNLPSVRKVNCRETNKRKKNRRKRNSAGKETLLSNANTPLGLQSRPGADLSCLRQLSAPGLQKIDVCENLELCKGRVPSISLQVLCGSGCVKSRKFREKHRKTWFFIRFSLKISERDQKRRQETPKVRKWSKSEPKEAKSEPKGAKMWAKGSPKWAKGSQKEPKGSQRATNMH